MQPFSLNEDSRPRTFRPGDRVTPKYYASIDSLVLEDKQNGYPDRVALVNSVCNIIFHSNDVKRPFTIANAVKGMANCWHLVDYPGIFRESWLIPAYGHDIPTGTLVSMRYFKSWEGVVHAEERVRQGGPLDKQKITVTETHAQYLLLPRNKAESFAAYPAYSHDQTYYLEGIDERFLWRGTWLSRQAEVKVTKPGTYQVIDYQGINKQANPGRALNKVLATLRKNKEEKEMNTPLKWEHYFKNLMNLSETSAKRAGSAALADKIVSLIHSRVNLPLPAHLRLLKWFPDVEAVVLLSALYLGIRLSGQTGEVFKQAEKVCWYALEGKTYEVAKRLIDQFSPLVMEIARIGKDALKNELSPSE